MRPSGVNRIAAPATRTPPARTAKIAPARPAVRFAASGERIGVFIDIDNTGAQIINVQEIVSVLKNQGTIVYGKLYGLSDVLAAQFDEIVRENRFETAAKMRMKATNQSMIDVRVVVDVLTMAEGGDFDTVFLWLGEGDLLAVFAQLNELGVKTMTVDLPNIDCKNKFVNSAIKLYSLSGTPLPTQSPIISTAFSTPYYPQSPAPAAPSFSSPAPAATEQNAPIPTLPRKAGAPPVIDDIPPPALPRKKGAPEFGSKENVDLIESREIDEEEIADMGEDAAANYILNLARDTLLGKTDIGKMKKTEDTEPKLNFDENGVLSVAAPKPQNSAYGYTERDAMGGEPAPAENETVESTENEFDVGDLVAEMNTQKQEQKYENEGDKTASTGFDAPSESSGGDNFTDFGDDFGGIKR
jgi:uncharacterized LabA/DUF88 family protein